MKVIISGGLGFLGSQLARHLLSRSSFLGAPITSLVLLDVHDNATAVPDLAANPVVSIAKANVTDAGTCCSCAVLFSSR